MRIAAVGLAVVLIVGLAPGAGAAVLPQEGVTAIPWLQPPPEFKEAQRKGFHAGVQAAIKDYDHHRFPDYNRRREYRHPHIDAAYRDDFRQGFRRGYDDAIHHLEKNLHRDTQ